MADSPLFGRVALIGIGLIGSSLARAMRQHKLAGHIAGHAKSERTRNTALKLGLVDSIRGADFHARCTARTWPSTRGVMRLTSRPSLATPEPRITA